MSAKKKEEPKLTFKEEVAEVLKRIPLNRQEIGSIVNKIDKLAEKHFPTSEDDK